MPHPNCWHLHRGRRGFEPPVGHGTSAPQASSVAVRAGWDRTRLDGTEGARIWTGHGVLAHNLVKITALAA